VFYRVAPAKYDKVAAEKPLVVIDGCGTRCASKLASEKGLKIVEKLNVSEEAKSSGIAVSKSLRLGEEDKKLARMLAESILNKADAPSQQEATAFDFPDSLHYETYTKDKFVFRIPTEEGFYFNENDVWAYVKGNKARIGVTDFVQKSLSDIMYFTPPAIGNEVTQFEEMGEIESGKAVFEIVSPVSGTITAINTKLLDAPELLNDNPYEQGWIAEMELADFEEDKDLLHEFSGYYPVLKRKVDEFRVKN
jgi:glycine cleavage system H protein